MIVNYLSSLSFSRKIKIISVILLHKVGFRRPWFDIESLAEGYPILGEMGGLQKCIKCKLRSAVVG